MPPHNSPYDLLDTAADGTARNALALFEQDPEFRELFDPFDFDRLEALLNAAAASAKYSARLSIRRSDFARA